MLLSDYLKIGESLEKIGVFDPILDKDNAFFINISFNGKAGGEFTFCFLFEAYIGNYRGMV